MSRLLFEKTGNAIYISHLDLMRVFQRAFKRACLPLTHTRGYNPRPSVSIALPLSVGVESCCELLDFTLDGSQASCEQIKTALNKALVPGVRVLEVYPDGAKLRDLAYLRCAVTLEYDAGIPRNAARQIGALFAQPVLTVEKKGKNGVTQQDIIPLIESVEFSEADACTLCITALICCQNPALNPNQLTAAIECYLPELKPDFSFCRRLEIYNTENEIFR